MLSPQEGCTLAAVDAAAVTGLVAGGAGMGRSWRSQIPLPQGSPLSVLPLVLAMEPPAATRENCDQGGAREQVRQRSRWPFSTKFGCTDTLGEGCDPEQR